MKAIIICLAATFAVVGVGAMHTHHDRAAHSGGTDALGCHTDHKTNYWHCHPK